MEARTSWKTLTLAAAVCLALPTAAFAQALQVFVFGDAGVVAQSNKPYTTSSGTAKGTSLALNSGPWQASRFGFRGKLKLNDDFDAWYDAATTVNLTQGLVGNPTTASQFFLFDRNAFVGVTSKKYGSLTLGRHPTPVTEALWIVDPLKANNGATNLNGRFGYMFAPGTILYANFGTNPGSNTNGIGLDRQSNTLRYFYGSSGFLGMATYGFGGQTGDRSKNMYLGGMLGYDSDGVAGHGAQDRHLDDVPNAFAIRVAGQMFNDNGTLAGTAADPKIVSLYSWAAGAVGRMGAFKAKVSYAGHKVGNTSFYGGLKTQLVAAGLTYSVQDVDLTVAAYNISRSLEGYDTQRASKFYFVPEWYWTKNFWVYGILAYEVFNTPAATVPTATGTPAILTGAGPIDASGTGGNVLAPGAKSSVYTGIGISFFFNT